MLSVRKLSLAALLLGACSDKVEHKAAAAPPPPPPVVATPAPSPATVVTYDPASGHLDEGPGNTASVRPSVRRSTRPIELVLRSTPGGAKVFVDGEDKGTTPVMWQGETGEHVFTFVKKDHAMARYRFWAITSGVVHGKLEPVVEEVNKGSTTPPPELVSPHLAPPPTLVSPDAATPKVLAPDAAPMAPAVDAASMAPAVDAPPASPIGPAP